MGDFCYFEYEDFGMDKNRLYKILEFNKKNVHKTRAAVAEFYDIVGISSATMIRDIQALAAIISKKQGFRLIRMPLKSAEIGALWLKLNELNYLVLNTSRSQAYNNFALVHEFYHCLIQGNNHRNIADIYLNNYEDDEEEMLANSFAGAVIMPTSDFKGMVGLLKECDRIGGDVPYIDEICLVITLMNYFKTTYMSVVIRCYELNIFDISNVELANSLLKFNNEKQQKEVCNELAKVMGNISVMEPTRTDDFFVLLNEAERVGNEQIEAELITKEDLEHRISGMKSVYNSIVEAGE